MQVLLLLGEGNDAVKAVSALSVTPEESSADGEVSARTIVSAQYAILPSPTEALEAGQVPNADVQNVTLWCGATWETAQPVALRALDAAAEALAQLAAPTAPGDGSANNEFRQFVIVTFVLACVGARPGSACQLMDCCDRSLG